MKLQGATYGAKEASAELAALGAKIAKKTMRRAITKGARVVAKAAKSGAPRDSGTLRKAITSKAKTYPSGYTFAIVGPKSDAGGTVAVKVKRGKKRFTRQMRRVPRYYVHLVELGTAAHAMGKGAIRVARGKKAAVARGAQHPGSRPRRFLERAEVGSRSAVAAIVGAEVAAEIAKVR